MELKPRHLLISLAISGLLSGNILPTLAQANSDRGSNDDGTTCGAGLREAFFRTYHYSLWVCQQPKQANQKILVIVPRGQRFQRVRVTKVNANYRAVIGDATFVANTQTLEIYQGGKVVAREKMLESAGSDAQAAAQRQLCRRAINSALTKLRSTSNISTVRLRIFPIRGYANPPRPNTMLYAFSMQGSGGLSVLASPKLMRALADRILWRCEQVDRVDFGMAQTDNFTTFGNINGTVEKFKCVEAGIPDRPTIQWGEVVCP